jgi:hypothetical protein
MRTQRINLAGAILHTWSICLLVCLSAVPAGAQSSQPIPVLLLSGEAPGLFCVPPTDSTEYCVLRITI